MQTRHVSLAAVAALMSLPSTAAAAQTAPAPVAPAEPAVTAEPAPAEPAAPAEAPAAASAEVSVTSSAPPAAATSTSKAAKSGDTTPWIKRYRPRPLSLELGIYGGVLLPAKDHELYNPNQMWLAYKSVAPDIGLRAGFYPLSFLGLEIEGGVAPTKTSDGKGALIGMFRGYAIAQLPYRIAPFALFGGGMMGTNALGKDLDPAIHYGGGVKFYVNKLIVLRLDARDNLAAQKDVAAGRTHHLEILLGVSIVLGFKKEPVKEKDSDNDGFLDSGDDCPTVPGVAPRGCPAPTPADSDGDGFVDADDTCPTVAGIAPDGCPEKDSDNDGFLDSKDVCPALAGVAPDGCPPPDKDADGIIDRDDKCIDIPETRNNYQDADGCPDELPKDVQKFTGVIEGIFFDVDKDVIKPKSKATLDAAVKVLTDFPDVNVEISGHTDSDGDRDHNIDLSQRRADAVKKYLVDKGIKTARITTRGAGPDQPIAENTTAENKAKNRRIEFKLQ